MVKNPPPRRMNNEHEREHEWITYAEFKAIHKAAAAEGRYGRRDALMVLMAFRHGLRAAELTRMKWDHLDLQRRTYYVLRVKKGARSTHDLSVEEVRELKKLTPNEQNRVGHVFISERGGPFSTRGFFRIVRRAGEEGGYAKPLHPHMFRHGCGYHMTNSGRDVRVIQEWLGHQNIQHTMLYTKLAPGRLRGAFPDEE
jgi:type 1 fimbriae regulatory protein FimB/type 1 fimbriae regulatory protein FimE